MIDPGKRDDRWFRIYAVVYVYASGQAEAQKMTDEIIEALDRGKKRRR